MASHWTKIARMAIALLVLTSGLLVAAPPATAKGSGTTTIVELYSLEALRRSEGDDEIYVFQGADSPFRGHQVRPNPDSNCEHVDYWKFDDKIRVQYPGVRLLSTQGVDHTFASLYDQDDGVFFLGGSDDWLGSLMLVSNQGNVTLMPFAGTWIEGAQPDRTLVVMAWESRQVVVHYDTADAHYRAVFDVFHIRPDENLKDDQRFNPVCE